jgi:hypothetical protein
MNRNNLEPARPESAVRSGLGILVSRESARRPKSDSAAAHPPRTRETVDAQDASLPDFAAHPCQSRRAGIRRRPLDPRLASLCSWSNRRE